MKSGRYYLVKTKITYLFIFFSTLSYASDISPQEQKEIIKNLEMLINYDFISQEKSLDQIQKKQIKQQGEDDV